MFELGCGLSGCVRRGDEDVVLFYELVSILFIICLMVDNGNRFVWSGYKDGKIMFWKMDYGFDNKSDDGEDDIFFSEGFFW